MNFSTLYHTSEKVPSQETGVWYQSPGQLPQNQFYPQFPQEILNSPFIDATNERGIELLQSATSGHFRDSSKMTSQNNLIPISVPEMISLSFPHLETTPNHPNPLEDSSNRTMTPKKIRKRGKERAPDSIEDFNAKQLKHAEMMRKNREYAQLSRDRKKQQTEILMQQRNQFLETGKRIESYVEEHCQDLLIPLQEDDKSLKHFDLVTATLKEIEEAAASCPARIEQIVQLLTNECALQKSVTSTLLERIKQLEVENEHLKQSLVFSSLESSPIFSDFNFSESSS